ncbi:MAG: YebC/PmpR family DNA-binding transcriptional regulator [Solitalea-like symbiont of Acarus siro]
MDSPFKSFGAIHKILEEKIASIIETEVKRVPTVTKAISEELFIELEKLINKLEEDEDINFVYTNAIKN